ncbi:MAG: type II secretion system protein [Undibacterium sp.]|uniref:pilin n=1 Tax=Undibacterium sp. TaxID=1914977 RepID=UPI00272350CB|nr:type II secretion system protein [Undibacterium sp.]MDO8652000.1 type II secretion system protein [Undibacterium sp.]
MNKKQTGFTLIELIIVIAILGILSALALPRFAALQTDARMAKMNGALGALKAGAVLAHSIQLTQNLTPATSVTMEGAVIPMANGYPTTALLSIGLAAGIVAPDFVPVATSGTVFTVTPDAGHPACAITYTTSAVVGTAPVYSNAGVIVNNC